MKILPMSDQYDITELYRLLANLIRIGTIEEADYKKALVRVKSGEQLTGWIPWITRRASKDSDWWAPEIGEQVILLAPCGDPVQAVALPSIYQDKHPSPEDRETIQKVTFDDGAWCSYDREAKKMSFYTPGDIEINAGGEVKIKAVGNMWLDAAHIHWNLGG